MKSFWVRHEEPHIFVEKVSKSLAKSGLDKIVSVRLDGSDLVAIFRWMGTTKLRYRLSSLDDGFQALLVSEEVSPLHAPFRQKFDEQFEQALERVGASVGTR